MSTYMAMPRTGHLNQLYQMFGYLKAHPKRKLAYDAQHPRISEKIFKQYKKKKNLERIIQVNHFMGTFARSH